MNDPENFIARWSRRKRHAADDPKPAVACPPAAASTESAEQPRDKSDPAPVVSGASEAGFDVTKLPSVDTITADTDIRAFLAPGVPTELTRAALRRAWAADPKVRDFVGLADYDWDFNTPGAIPGFGLLEMTDELRRQVADMVGRSFTTGAAPTAADQQNGQASVETSIESGDATAGNLPLQAGPTQQVESNRGPPQDDPVNSEVELQHS